MNNKSQIDFFKLEVQRINNLLINEKYDLAIEKSKEIIKKFPQTIQPYNILGVAYRKQFKIDKAKQTFLQALEIHPKSYSLLTNMGSIYKHLNEFLKAEKMYLEALKIKADYTPALENYANLKRELNEIDKSIELYEKAYKINANIESVLLSLSTTYQIVGKFDLSKKILNILSQKFPSNTIADKMLSDLIDYSDEKIHQKKMLIKINDIKINETDKVPLYFGIAKSYNDQKNYKKSFEFLEKGNKEKKKFFKISDIKDKKKYYKRIVELFDQYKFEKKNKVKTNNNIFIVGLPRSGTTLLHQIISSHSNTYGAGELTILDDFFVNKIFNKNFFNNVITSNTKKKNYIKNISTEIFLKFKNLKNDKIIIDKMPSNFLWIGLIKIFLPNAKIIHISRNIKDNCLSIYKNLFDKDSLRWAYDQNDIIQYVRIYKALMKFWKKKLPNFIYDLSYENLVNNQINESKKMLKFCNLKWENNCKNYFETKSTVKTASIIQVRKPIYKTSLNQSKEYLQYLDFLKKLKN